MDPENTAWWTTFFDEDYLRLWGGVLSAERTEREAADLWLSLDLAPGARVLDAPCGYGRLARALAERGARVLGVDQSAAMIARAETERGDASRDALRYARHDLRRPLDEDGFDAAINVFSSIGYGGEADDLAVLATIRAALRPGGTFLLETMHRDMLAVGLARGGPAPMRFADGTLVVEEPRFDAVTGRVETCWHWAGPAGCGRKPASLRVYSVTELVALVERAGFEFRAARSGFTGAPFEASGPTMGGRVGIVAVRAS